MSSTASDSVQDVAVPSGDAAAMAEWLRHSLDPEAWAFDRFGFVCDPWQSRVLHSTDPRLLILSSRQVGKSTIVALLAAWTAVFRPHSLILLISRTQLQAKELFLKASEYLKQIEIALSVDNLLSCRLASNGSRLISLSADQPDSLRGYSAPNVVLVDEATFCLDETAKVVFPLMATSKRGGKLIAMATPHAKFGWFFEAWTNGGAAWSREQISCYDCPRISREYLELMRLSMPEWQFRSEFLCEFGDEIEQCYSTDLIRACVDMAYAPLGANWENDFEVEGYRYVWALDLGFKEDYSALVVDEVMTIRGVDATTGLPTRRIVHGICHLQRWSLRTEYLAVLGDVRALMQKHPQGTRPHEMLLDATGVGEGICQMARGHLGMSPVSVMITGGTAVTNESHSSINVPKFLLASDMDAVLQTGRMRIAGTLPLCDTFVSELASFDRTPTRTGNSFGARGSTKDDLVLAAQMAIFWVERPEKFHRPVLITA